MKEYKTVEFESKDEFIEKKSRFIGYVKPVKTQEEATEFINSIKSKHWDATHNVSAYVLRDNNIQRSSDDGEPSGTAAGGLIRAYSHASKIAIDAGHIITMAPCKVISVSVDYSFYDRLNILLNEFSANIENSEFTDSVTVIFSIRENTVSLLQDKLTQLSNGKYLLKEIGEKFAKVE